MSRLSADPRLKLDGSLGSAVSSRLGLNRDADGIVCCPKIAGVVESDNSSLLELFACFVLQLQSNAVIDFLRWMVFVVVGAVDAGDSTGIWLACGLRFRPVHLHVFTHCLFLV